MRRAFAALLLLTLLLTSMPATARADEVAPTGSPLSPGLWTGRLREGTAVYEAMSLESARLGYLKQRAVVDILSVEPDWLLVRYGDGQGYIRRHRMDDTSVTPTDPASTPGYAAVPCGFLAWAGGETPVLDAPDNEAKTLVTLQAGARIALKDISDGWARVVYHRQWGYISTRHLREILPFNHALAPGDEAPVAAYTSFYNLSRDPSNQNRIVNLRVACERMQAMVFQPGDALDFNAQVGPYSRRNGYLQANVILLGEIVQGYGGGTCQVSSTLYNAVLQLPGIEIVRRRAHGVSAASYLPHGADAAVGSDMQNFIIRNHYPFPVRMDGTVQDGALTIAVYRAD